MLGFLAAACVSGDPPSQSGGTSTSHTAPQDATQSEWIRYTDETSGFSVSYPPDWEVFEVDTSAAADLLTQVEDATGAVGLTLVFAAGRPLRDGTGFVPNVNIAVELLPDPDVSPAEYAESGKRGAALTYPSFTVTEQSEAVVGGREVVIVRASLELAELPGATGDGRFWTVQLTVPVNPLGWNVNCGSVGLEESDVTEDLEVCDSVVRSFELLSP